MQELGVDTVLDWLHEGNAGVLQISDEFGKADEDFITKVNQLVGGASEDGLLGKGVEVSVIEAGDGVLVITDLTIGGASVRLCSSEQYTDSLVPTGTTGLGAAVAAVVNVSEIVAESVNSLKAASLADRTSKLLG